MTTARVWLLFFIFSCLFSLFWRLEATTAGAEGGAFLGGSMSHVLYLSLLCLFFVFGFRVGRCNGHVVFLNCWFAPFDLVDVLIHPGLCVWQA